MIIFWLSAVLLLIIATGTLLHSLLSIKKSVLRKSIRQAEERQTKHQNGADKKSARDDVTIKPTAILLCLFIPFFTVILYLSLGQPSIIKKISVLDAFNNTTSHEKKAELVEKLLTELEEKVQQDADNLDGWVMLNNIYLSLQRYRDALRSMDNIYRLRPEDHTVQLQYADLLLRVHGSLDGKATQLIDKALVADPNNPSGLWLAGLAAKERGDNRAVIDYWTTLLPFMTDNIAAKKQLADMIDAVKANEKIKDTHQLHSKE